MTCYGRPSKHTDSILKDRPYTTLLGPHACRAAQTVLYKIAMVRPFYRTYLVHCGRSLVLFPATEGKARVQCAPVRVSSQSLNETIPQSFAIKKNWRNSSLSGGGAEGAGGGWQNKLIGGSLEAKVDSRYNPGETVSSSQIDPKRPRPPRGASAALSSFHRLKLCWRRASADSEAAPISGLDARSPELGFRGSGLRESRRKMRAVLNPSA